MPKRGARSGAVGGITGRTTDTGGLDLRIDRLEVREHADAGVTTRDLGDGVGEVVQLAAEVPDLPHQASVLRLERCRAGEIEAARHCGIAHEHGAHEQQDADSAGEPQQAPRHLEHFRGCRAVRHEKNGPPAFCHDDSALSRSVRHSRRPPNFMLHTAFGGDGGHP